MRSIIVRCLFLVGSCVWLTAPASDHEDRVILVVGDSLSAGYGIEIQQSWPRLLENRLVDNGQRYQVVNASITGDTTQGGLARLPRLLEKHQPHWVIIELGGNDGLRGLPLDVTHANLDEMIRLALGSGAGVVLTGIMLPPNYGPRYTERFHAMYSELASQYDLLLVPFFMEGIALKDNLMQADGIHPNAAAQPLLMENVWEVLGPALGSDG